MYRLLPLLLLLFSCKKEKSEAVSYMNVAYGADARQKMDIYLPAGRTSSETNVIVLIHGGGWAEGDKTDFTPYIQQIQQKLPGYAIFNINYRLVSSGANIFPAQENDVKTAIEFIDTKRGDYNISGKYVYLGASAGGHLALLQAYKHTSPVNPKAVVSFFGPTDLINLYNSNFLAAAVLLQATGGAPTDKTTLYQQSSPSFFVNAASPPTLLLHGGADPLVPSSQASFLQTLLANAGVANQYVFYPSEGHGWSGSNLDDSFNKIAAFLHTYVR